MEAARQAERSQDYERASAAYRKILELRPDWALIRQSLALTYHLRSLYTEAIAEFERAIALDPGLWGSHLFLGMDYYKSNQFDKAIPALRRSLELNARQVEPEARFWLGAAYAAIGRHDQAIDELRRLAQLKPRDIEVHYSLARSYDQHGSYLYEQVGRIEPKPAFVHLLQAERFLSEGRADLAGLEFDKALALRPDLKRYLPALDPARMPPAEGPCPRAGGTAPLSLQDAAFCENGQDASAESELKARLRKDPRNAEALYALGRIYKRLAARSLQEMIAIDPDSHRVNQLVAERHEERTEYEAALESYQKALRKRPDLAGLRYAIGNVYWKTRQYDLAARWLEEELKNNPGHSLAHYRLGSLYVDQDKADLGVPHLEQALRVYPKLTGALIDLGRGLTLQGRYEEAVAVFQKAAASDPGNDRIHFLLSTAYLRLGRRKEADMEMAKYRELNQKRLENVQQEVRSVSDALGKRRE